MFSWGTPQVIKVKHVMGPYSARYEPTRALEHPQHSVPCVHHTSLRRAGISSLAQYVEHVFCFCFLIRNRRGLARKRYGQIYGEGEGADRKRGRVRGKIKVKVWGKGEKGRRRERDGQRKGYSGALRKEHRGDSVLVSDGEHNRSFRSRLYCAKRALWITANDAKYIV